MSHLRHFVVLLALAALLAAPLVHSDPAPSATALRAARQLIVALASENSARDGASPRRAKDARARAIAHLSALGLARVGTLSDFLPLDVAGSRALRTDHSPAPGATPNPFALDPTRVILVEASDSLAARSAQAALAGDEGIEWVESNALRELQGWWGDGAAMRPADARSRGFEAPRNAAPSGLTIAIPSFPNDPLFQQGQEYGIFNVGPSGPFHGVTRADVHANEAWLRTTGANDLILAIGDTGIDPSHPDLAGFMPNGSPRLLGPINITGIDPPTAYADSFGHGTVVVGVMAARTNNGSSFASLGLAGVCGGDGAANAGCRIVPIKITQGNDGEATAYDIAHALLYATALGARGMNLSFAGTSPSRTERLALYQAITHGCVMVVASGNSGYTAGTKAQYPSAYSADGLCLQVGASDWNDTRVVFSSYGPGLDLLAPGVNIYTTFMTYPSAAGGVWPGYVPASGTSLAAPFVTGAVGLLAAARPELIENDFQRLIRESADDIGAPGVDPFTGWGRLNINRALQAVAPAIGIWHDEVLGTLGAQVDQDTLFVGESGPGVMDVARVWPQAKEYEVTATVAVPDSFLPPVRVWPRVGGTFTVRPGFHLPYFAPWADVKSQSATSFTLRGYLYQRADGCTNCDEFLPLPPDQARIGFTVIGRVDRAPTVVLRGLTDGQSFAPGDSVGVSFDANDPDTITAIQVRLEQANGAGVFSQTLSGTARWFGFVMPCLGQFQTHPRLRVIAIDGHGPHFDQGEASVTLAVRAGACRMAGPPAIAVAPNPGRGPVRIDGPAGSELEVIDLAGRVVRRARLAAAGAGAASSWVWDGFDAAGARARAGIYFVRVRGAGVTLERKLVRLE